MDGYYKAQLQYDNQLPPDDEDEEAEASRKEAYQEYLEKKADEARDEALIELNDHRQYKYWEDKM